MKPIGLRAGTVMLIPHTEEWHRLFDEEQRRLGDAIGTVALAIEHMGSTAVRGLAAKPIIDIAVAVRDIDDVALCVRPLQSIGYIYRGELGIPGRHFFCAGEPRTHHLHMSELTSEHWWRHLLFRDCLRDHPETRGEYEELKMSLADRYGNDREAYTEGKSAFIQSLLVAAVSGRYACSFYHSPPYSSPAIAG